jgi:hypothetical protein
VRKSGKIVADLASPWLKDLLLLVAGYSPPCLHERLLGVSPKLRPGTALLSASGAEQTLNQVTIRVTHFQRQV